MPIYRAIYDGPPRWHSNRRTAKKYIMIHATANTASAENEASYAKRRPSRVSSHYYVDDDSIVQSLDTDLRAWHAGNDEGNDHAIAYELTARNMNVGRAWWLDLSNIEWPLFAGQVAADCRAHGITPQALSDAQLRAGASGFTTHVQGNRVWSGSDHTDPGPNFPMDHLVRQVRALLDEEDDMTPEELLDTSMSYPGSSKDRVKVETALKFGMYHSGRARHYAYEAATGVEAILAAIAGHDVAKTFRAELTRHRAELVTELSTGLADSLVDELRPALGEVSRETVEAAVRNVLGGLDDEDQEPA